MFDGFPQQFGYRRLACKQQIRSLGRREYLVIFFGSKDLSHGERRSSRVCKRASFRPIFQYNQHILGTPIAMTIQIFSTVDIIQRHPCIEYRRSSRRSAFRIADGSSGDDGSLSDPSLYCV